MVDRGSGYCSEKSGSSLSALSPTDPVFGFKTPDAAATRSREAAFEALDRSWTEAGTRGGRFDAFRALPDEARAAWLAHAVARTLEASVNLPGGRVCAFHDHLGQLLGIDVAKWWRPTGANYFDRVPKAMILGALEEVGGPAFASRYAKAKKAELSQSAERIFAGDFIGEIEVKERALAWVPEAMLFAPAQGVDPAEETPPWEDEPTEVTIAGCDSGRSGEADFNEAAGDEEPAVYGVEESHDFSTLDEEQESDGGRATTSPGEQEIEEAA
jgi:ParB family chromosome partitioning protein